MNLFLPKIIAVLAFLQMCDLQVDITIDQSTCGKTKGCFMPPKECDPNTDCVYFASYARKGDEVVFELSAPAPTGTRKYIAIGFNKEGSTMSPAAVTECVFTDGTAAPELRLSTNVGRSNSKIVMDDNTRESYVRLIAGTMTNNRLVCKFAQKITHQNDQGGRVYPLDGNSYHLMVATGPAQDGGLGKHPSSPVLTSAALNVTQTLAAVASSKILKKLHGSVMLVAWWVCSTIAILFAAYFKTVYPQTKPMGIAIWFHFHRGLHGTTVLLVIISIVLILIAEKGKLTFLGTGFDLKQIHSLLGLLTVILMIVQPLNALARCGPTDERRPIFNWTHTIIGYATWLLSQSAVLSATIFFEGPNGDDLTAFRYVVFVAWALAMLGHIVLGSLHEYHKKVLKDSSSVGGGNTIAMQSYGAPDANMPSDTTVTDTKYNKMKPIALGVYTVIMLIVTIIGVVMLITL